MSDDVKKAAAALGKIGGKSKSPAKLAALEENRKKAAEARRKQRSGPTCKRCNKTWEEHDRNPCR